MSPPPAPLFDDAAVPLPLLRQRAFNQRWAEQPEGVIPRSRPPIPISRPRR
jgi:hypothetical protein